jgi:hypothetical protein
MKIYLFVAEDGEAAQNLIREGQERGLDIMALIGDDVSSVNLRQMYDVTTRPAALVTLEDGSYVHMWQGRLPSISELNYAVQGR